jgi:hypothetical protein
MAQAVEHLPRKHKALNSNPIVQKKNNSLNSEKKIGDFYANYILIKLTLVRISLYLLLVFFPPVLEVKPRASFRLGKNSTNALPLSYLHSQPQMSL